MTEQSPAEAIFFNALEKRTAEERIAYVRAACGDDSNLRQRVERLLAAHRHVGNFLEASSSPEMSGTEAPADPPVEEYTSGPGPAETRPLRAPDKAVGTVVAGRYKLLESLGEGGMGAVFMAQQTAPIRRLVALKLIKQGMDTRQILARFEAERQALALMDHPNIAKVLDAGATESGRPYFVMELVKGVPITRFCDERQLSPRERLELLIPVCHAIQHAHQKGVIHRDIKPTNVLVCLYDDHPVPKVIDFGVAKAAGSQLTDASLVTGFGAIVGTPEHMSPEQAQLNQLDIDTRSDVYALGVLLYELLTGTTPIDRKRLGQGALLEVLRVIREEEPPRPSARLSSSETLASIAATRRTAPATLTKLVRGELDWIVMKCLEKERSRRYETANALARDLERYLHDDVVEARPPSASYRLRKFVRKHRVGIGTASAFVALLIAAAGISAVLAIRARRAELVARDKRLEAEANAKQAEANAELAKRNGEAYSRQFEQNLEGRAEAELRALSLRVDLDLSELRSDRRLGLLRLARPMKTKWGPISLIPILPQEPGAILEQSIDFGQNPECRQLREFVTMAVLAIGQSFAPLLKPITHDGQAVHASYFSASGHRLVTLGEDKSARLWDAATGRLIAILRTGDEQAIETGLSPDGATAFTHSPDGVRRLWETDSGAFRAKFEPRSESIESSDPESGFSDSAETLLSNDRVLTFDARGRTFGKKVAARPALCELWNAETGQLITRLGLPRISHPDFEFVVNGRWIVVHDAFDEDQMLHLFSAENGHPTAKLKHGAESRFCQFATKLSPVGRTAASVYTLGRSLGGDGNCQLNFWDTTSWKLTSVAGPLEFGPDEAPEIQWIADDLIAIHDYYHYSVSIYRPMTPFRISRFRDSPYVFRGEQVVLNSGQIYNTRSGARLSPPTGRKYHPELARFTPDGRFLPNGIDTLTEKTIPGMGTSLLTEPKNGMGTYVRAPKYGWVGIGGYRCPELPLRRLPTPDRLTFPAHLLELWAQVATRGHLDDEGAFVKWDEPTWEKKRQDLAAMPALYPDFPFPGYLAVDRLYWLRQEFENASNADKPRLAKQLLEGANLAGDKVEAIRWIDVIASSVVDSLITKPLLRADVEETVRQRVSLPGEIRAAALLKAARLVENASDLNAASWAIAARPNAGKEEYRRALRWAEAAVRHEPENSAYVNALGVLQYRNGLYKNAIATLTRSHNAHRNSKTGQQPSDLAFFAMAHHALGETDKAHDYFRQLEGLCDQPQWKAETEAAGFLKEARERLAAVP